MIKKKVIIIENFKKWKKWRNEKNEKKMSRDSLCSQKKKSYSLATRETDAEKYI